mgnify:CR=1 FL=1
MSVGETYGRSPQRPTVGRLDDLPWVAEAIHGRVLRRPSKPAGYAGLEKGLRTNESEAPLSTGGEGPRLRSKPKGLAREKGAIPALRRCANERSRVPAECSPELHAGVLPLLRSSWVGLDGSPLCWQAG